MRPFLGSQQLTRSFIDDDLTQTWIITELLLLRRKLAMQPNPNRKRRVQGIDAFAH